MEAQYIALVFHILCGTIAIVTMILAFLTKKGPNSHAKIGRIYCYAMIGVCVTAIALFLFGSSAFLLLIAFFSLYLVLVGWRFAVNRKGAVTEIDNILVQFGVIGGAALLIMSAFIVNSDNAPFGRSKTFAAVPMIFGIISIALANQQHSLQKVGNNPRGKERINLHVTYMGAGTISTVTAFTITVLGSSIFTWLGATIVGTPLLIWNQVGVNKGTIAKSVVESE
ncbi:MAG TPA: hypothetical protein QGF70_05300 [Candidatus Thalassarchaeaceae archaeon]|nr:hypothetical protein [Candidatus Thalassarchaeaceae archaeon]